MRALPWWDDRITGALMSYWVYQHIGNLSPPELAEETMLRLVHGDDDAGPRLREFARRCDRESASSRWAYYRDFGRSRLLVIDSRAARVLAEGRRDMIDEGEWQWIVEHARGQFDHLILASTLPVFMSHGVHHLEALSEAVCDGAWGVARPRSWASACAASSTSSTGPRSTTRSACSSSLLDELARGDDAPGTILLLGGDVHTAYVADVTLGDGAAPQLASTRSSARRSAIRSTPMERRVVRLAGSRVAAAIFSWLARRAGVADVPVEVGDRARADVRELDRHAGAGRTRRAPHDQRRARPRRRGCARAAARGHAVGMPGGERDGSYRRLLTQRRRARSGR